MENLTFQVLNDQDSIEKFINKFEDHTSVRLPSEYVSKSRIVGVFLQNKLVAGYMLVTKPDFRSLLFVPDQIKKENKFFKTDKYEMMEVNGLWISPSVKSPKMQFRVWTHLLLDIFSCRKKYLLLLSNKRNKAVEHIHSLTNPTKIYEGAPNLLPGYDTHQNVRVAYTTRWNLILNLPKYFFELRNREARLTPAFRQKFLART